MIIHKFFGLDLGTTNSTVAIVKDGKVLFGVEDKIRKNKTIPSIIALKRNGKEVVGTAAKNEFYIGNENSIKSIKRSMGKDEEFSYGDEFISPEYISSKIISYCKKCLDETIDVKDGVIYDGVVITVPAYFSLAQKDATRKAGELAGLNVKMLLEEPTAAAINFAIQNNIENGIFFVFDLGGGTFDVSILEKTGSVPEVLATAGNNFLGGDNFDFLLARYFLNYLEEGGYDIDDVIADKDDTKFRCLLLLAENVKKQLSTEEVIDIHYQDVFKDNSIRDLDIDEFSREQFNEIIKDKVKIDIIGVCDNALNLLESKTGKTLKDITHILMVGGSSKIPYIKEVIKEKYCVTENLKDVTSFEPDLSVSAGAAFIANSLGFTIEDPNNDILVNINSPFSVNDKTYISGIVEKGVINKISIKNDSKEYFSDISDNKTFLITLDTASYSDEFLYSFYKDNYLLNNIQSDNNSLIDLIAPNPIQNETIFVQIVDVEKGNIEKYPLLKAGQSLPCESIEYFKINEYSDKKIILPIWEGSKKIFNLHINLNETMRIGDRLKVKTYVDNTSNISIEVVCNGTNLKGNYEYIENSYENSNIDNINELFDERIEFIEDFDEKNKLIEEKNNIVRELDEAIENHDLNHYTSVSDKLERFVFDLPSERILHENDFNNIKEKINSMKNEFYNVDDYEIDNLVFHGKRYLQKNNLVEANKCYEKLVGIKNNAELFSSADNLLEISKATSVSVIQQSLNLIDNDEIDMFTKDEIKEQIELIKDDVLKIINKKDYFYDNEKRDDAFELIRLTTKLHSIVIKIEPESEENNIYKGLVSKA